jgi:hypothetical protein
MFHQGIWAFLQKKFIITQGSWFFPESQVKNLSSFFFPLGTIMFLGEKNYFFPENMVAHWDNLNLASFRNVIVP